MNLRKPRISKERKRHLTRIMEIGIVGAVVIGAVTRDTKVLMNATLGLGVTFVPSVLERDYKITMDPSLTLWITGAVFLHVIGAVGIPGTGINFYNSIWWWDHLTHAASASLIAGAGYSIVRAVDEHTDAIYLPYRFTSVFILLFVLAFGVYWEVFEFGVAHIELRGKSVLTQYGVEDTMKDLVFNTVGGLIAATWGTAHLTPVVRGIRERLERP
ncbi:MAG: hypothetical protein SV377_06005 [Halobacteria archaeon]|nr:hypothetical protein [Halobacteria archaeon]